MKSVKRDLMLFSFSLSILLLTGCAATVQFTYLNQKPLSERKITSDTPVNFSIVDNRAEPDIIGYMDNMYGMRVKKIKPSEMDISRSIYVKYREELSKLGFVFSDNASNSPLKLTLTITTFLGEMRPGLINLNTTATCCMKALLTSGDEKNSLFKGNFCGNGEKHTALIAGKKDIPAALSLAVDDVLQKLANETDLINQINTFKK
jgi:uncharacterized lipoprotein YajG